MAKQKVTSEAQKKQELGCQLAGRLWLDYYNRTLYEKGLITEQERNRMSLKISGWQSIATLNGGRGCELTAPQPVDKAVK